MTKHVELLSPAGDAECLAFALGFGADAVYVAAKDFGMRASPANFTQAQIEDAAKLVHSAGKKLYLAVNIIPTTEEVRKLPGFLYSMAKAGVDAFIIADIGVLQMAKQYAPGVEIHLSTQAGIANQAAASAAHELGAKRVVLARELSLEEIADIRRSTPSTLELEVFVHGAMCMSISGRCLLSNYMAKRDANRGQCAQPCRWKYSLVEEKRPGQYYDIEQDEDGSYIFNADDLCAAPFLNKVIEAGATSLKIEGRAKSFYYVASVTAAYRAALNAALAQKESYQMPDFTKNEINKTSHRPFSSGFFFGRDGATQSITRGGYERAWQVLGVVYAQQDGRIFCVQRGKFTLGQELEALLADGRAVRFTPTDIQDKDGKPILATAQSKMIFSVPIPEGEDFPNGTILRRENP